MFCNKTEVVQSNLQLGGQRANISPKGISPKMNAIVRLGFELAY